MTHTYIYTLYYMIYIYIIYIYMIYNIYLFYINIYYVDYIYIYICYIHKLYKVKYTNILTNISISTTSGLSFLVKQCLELLGCATARDCSGNSSKSFPRVEGSKSSYDSCHSRVISAVYFRKIQKVNMFADFSQMTKTSSKIIHEMCFFFNFLYFFESSSSAATDFRWSCPMFTHQSMVLS